MRKALMSRVNAAVERNGYFGYQESRDDESNHHLLSRDGQCEDRWYNAGDDDERSAVQAKQSNTVTNTKPLLPDLSDSDSSASTESSKENKFATATNMTPSSVIEEESLTYSVETVKKVDTTPEEVADDEIVENSSTIDLDEGVEEKRRAVAVSVAEPLSPELDQDKEIENDIELEGSSSTVDFDDDLSLAETPVDIIEHQTPVHQTPVEEESEKRSIKSSPTAVKSYVSYTRHECPVVVSSSEHGDVILLSPKGFEASNTAKATLSVPSFEKDDESQDLNKKFEAIAFADPSLTSRKNLTAETEQATTAQSKKDEKTHSNDADDEFVISDDWSEDGSVGNSSDPFGECLVNGAVVQNITAHRLEDNATFLGREKKVKVEEETNATDDDSSSKGSDVSDDAPVSETSYKLADLDTNQLTSKSSSSIDLASFNQIWEGSVKMSEGSGSDSDECEESKLSDEKSNDDAAWDVSRKVMAANFQRERSVSDSTDKSDSSKSDEKDSFISLNNFWASEWNDLTSDDITMEVKAMQDSQNEEGSRDKYATASEEEEDSAFEEEEDSDEFYGRRLVEESDDYSYDSYGLETISEEGEFCEDEPAMPTSFDESRKEDEVVVETVLSEEEGELVSEEAEKIDEAIVESVNECTVDGVAADEGVSVTVEPSNIAKEDVIVGETVDEYSSDDEKSKVEEPMVQTTTSNDVDDVQKEALHELWSKIDEYQANGAAPRQSISTKTITPVKKHAVVKHSIGDSQRTSLPRSKRAGGSTDLTFDDLSGFLDGQDEKSENNFVAGADSSLASLETSNRTEELFQDDVKIDFDMQRTSVKRHVFTKLFAPVSALVTRRTSGKQDVGLSKARLEEPTNRSQEGACSDSNVESEDDREARELADLLSAAMMAREQAQMEKATAFAKQLAEIQEAVAIEQELAEIEGCGLGYDIRNSHDIVTPVENYSSSTEDDSQIEIIDEELVTATTPTFVASNESTEVENKDLHELWSKIDEYQASGKSMDTTQVAMMAKMLNSQIEEYQAPGTPGSGKSSPRRLRSSKHAVSVKKRAVANAKAKKSKYDVSYIETKSIVKNKKATEAGEELSSDLDHLAEPSVSLPDLEAQSTYESADLDAPTQVYLVPSATSLNSFASMISADKSSDSLCGVSKAGSDMSRGSLVSKLYSDNADLAETLAVTQYELEKAMKQLEKIKMEREELIATAVHCDPVPAPKSSFDDYFEPDTSEENADIDENEWYGADLGNRFDLCEI